jgi:hypothetical protein
MLLLPSNVLPDIMCLLNILPSARRPDAQALVRRVYAYKIKWKHCLYTLDKPFLQSFPLPNILKIVLKCTQQ